MTDFHSKACRFKKPAGYAIRLPNFVVVKRETDAEVIYTLIYSLPFYKPIGYPVTIEHHIVTIEKDATVVYVCGN